MEINKKIATTFYLRPNTLAYLKRTCHQREIYRSDLIEELLKNHREWTEEMV